MLDINDNGPLVQQQDTDFIVKAGAGKDVNIAQQIRFIERNKILSIKFYSKLSISGSKMPILKIVIKLRLQLLLRKN